MDWLVVALVFVLGWIFGTLASRRGSNGAALGIIATILAFIGLS